MADYDLSKPARDVSGTGTGGIGFILVGAVIVLVVLYAVFGGAGVPVTQDPSEVAPASAAPAADPAPVPVE